MSSSGSRASAASSASRTTASRSPSSTHARARSCWTAALRSRPAPSSALPDDTRFRGLAGVSGDGVRKLGDLRAVYRPLGVAADSENDWVVVVSAPRVRAASLLGVNSLPIALALLGVLLVGAWMARRWVRTSKDAITDALTGIGNRRKLIADLTRELPLASPARPSRSCSATSTGSSSTTTPSATPPVTLCWPGSDIVSSRRSASPAPRTGSAETSSASSRRSATSASSPSRPPTLEALSERGDGFDVGCSYGAVVATGDLRAPDVALRAADQLLYASKSSGRRSAGRQAADALLQALHERRPELGDHLHGVGDLATSVGERLGLSAEELDLLRQAGELHDIGKVAIPDSILSKPDSLDPDEWEFVRQHPLVGERIISAAPALAQVGEARAREPRAIRRRRLSRREGGR